ncbi:anthranilate synthase component I [Auraticoccus sp. F435]|uniref:Anthranilate synthase component 1 n=1 Tax=Auraticoccus cholistanensis TaxID=2656650 RepID=A0A6A9UXI0_9ACTN|nr:anthranilate synthase component I [Auraticoccus cholistanensis]MVA75987.1 anthranilate synthase component I [Auraticoccus cholistanensis]
MHIEPSVERFRELAREARVISVHTRLAADTETPVGLYAKLAGGPGSYLLESVEHGVWSRWSFIGVGSVATLTERDGRAVWHGRPPVGLPEGGDPLEALALTLERLHGPRQEGLPPLSSGLVGYLGYDTVRRIEDLPDGNVDDLGLPELQWMLISDLAVLDHQTGEVWLIANAVNFDDTDERVDEARADAVARIEAMAARLAEPTPSLVAVPDGESELRVHDQRTTAEYAAAVEAAVEEIRSGEAFQVVVSQRFDVTTTADALDVYRVLRLSNPSPYLYLLRLDGFDVIGSSPEALVTIEDGCATTHPIAGSRPRGADPVSDQAMEAELLADPKERAEHLMLVDLARNDLGRVCEPGTVAVTEFMQVRRYSHIMHLESSVSGRVRQGRTALDTVLACFPAGTLSGAPKVRAMQIIDELEVSRRGLYGGVVGYFDLAGDADVAIAIRTAVLRDGIAHVQAGGGIVADSVAATEDAESRNKAAAVMRAIARAERMTPLAASRPTPGGGTP